MSELERRGSTSATSWELFDGQASGFERRAGLPEEVCPLIAQSVVSAGGAGLDDLVVEIGPGTGQVGIWISKLARYIGLDFSWDMVSEFRRKLNSAGSGDALLLRSDAGGPWPVRDRTARLIFSSRALHLLAAEHIAGEVFRLAAPGGATLVVGRVERDRQSVRSQMAREMRDGLRSRGFEPHHGERETRRLTEVCERLGGIVQEPVMVAEWTVSTSARQSIEAWRLLRGLGGVPVPSAEREHILSELEGWAENRFGSLDRCFESTENYVLRPISIVGNAALSPGLI